MNKLKQIAIGVTTIFMGVCPSFADTKLIDTPKFSRDEVYTGVFIQTPQYGMFCQYDPDKGSESLRDSFCVLAAPMQQAKFCDLQPSVVVCQDGI